MHPRLTAKGAPPADTMFILFSTPLWLVLMDTEELYPVQSVVEDLPCGTQDIAHKEGSSNQSAPSETLPHLVCFLCYTMGSHKNVSTLLHYSVSGGSGTMVYGVSEKVVS